jgi:hypothetical protein
MTLSHTPKESFQSTIRLHVTNCMDKLPVAQIRTNFTTFCRTRTFIAVFTKTATDPDKWAKWMQFILPHPISLGSTLILSSHLHLGLPSGFFILAFPSKTFMHSSSFDACFMPCPSHPPWLDHSNYIWREVLSYEDSHVRWVPCHYGMQRP